MACVLGVVGALALVLPCSGADTHVDTACSAADLTTPSTMTTMHVLLAGPGLIGGELLQQFAKAKVPGLAIKLVGVARSSSYLLSKDGLDAATAAAKLSEGAGVIKGDVSSFVKEGAALGLPKTVFVDCTASEAVSPAYALALEHKLHVVTANKKVNSGDLDYRKQVLALASQPNGPRFRYETNVGAGLPIIRPLNDMVETGDKVLSIEAILSGTLAYLFNTFSKDEKFSEVVRKAKALGFTEPDPRDDLSGSDVARKIVILARDAGLAVGLDDVKIEGFLPEACIAAPSVDAFFETLVSDADPKMNAMLEASQAKGEVLRMLASLDATASPPSISIALRSVPASHPAASVSGSDNIAIITTDRYKENPLVVKGPGAGAAVTAAGVFADITALRDVHVA
eukprot:TRINITY_DN9190_c0_g1_i2.p1 TRINITY_DN9190_c0_g1~~TRINITY_DN9190_c0_g1_i2.p1  ORF type:complete len:399 (+),score=153.67 TRINITY_DN9190_c0_g1_i2:41-1237(+)